MGTKPDPIRSWLVLAMLLLGSISLLIPKSGADAATPTKTWFLHSRYVNPFYAGAFSISEQPPEISTSEPDRCGFSTLNGSIWGCFYFIVSQRFSLNVTSVTFTLDPSYALGLELLAGTANLQISMSASPVSSTDQPFSGTALFNISLSGPLKETIGTTVAPIIIPKWTGPYSPVWNTTTLPLSIPKAYVVPPQQPVRLVITWVNPSNENEINFYFNTTAHPSNLTFPVNFYASSLTLVADGSTTIRLGDTIHFRGHLTNTWNASGVGEATVTLIVHQLHSWEKSFLLASVVTSQTGDYAYSWSPILSEDINDFGVVASFEGSLHFAASNYSYLAVSFGKASSQLTIGLSVPNGYPGFSVSIHGTLKGLDGPIGAADIVISYKVPGSQTLTIVTSASTNSDGNYEAVWIPQATGNFTLMASWSGSGRQDSGEASASLVSSTPQGSGAVWVGTTGSVSGLTFDLRARILSFNLTGPIETGSTVTLYLPKTLSSVAPQAPLKVSGTLIDYKIQDANTAWIISFTTPSPSSNMFVTFGPLEAGGGNSVLNPALLILTGLAIAIVALLGFFVKRSNRTCL